MCSECGETFSVSSHLFTHKRTHPASGRRGAASAARLGAIPAPGEPPASAQGEKPFRCGQCEKRSASPRSRSTSARTRARSPYTCIECGKSRSRAAFYPPPPHPHRQQAAQVRGLWQGLPPRRIWRSIEAAPVLGLGPTEAALGGAGVGWKSRGDQVSWGQTL